MREYKRLLRGRRILAVLLAAAMAVTSVPATAKAAPAEPQTEEGRPVDEDPAKDDADGGQETGEAPEERDDGPSVSQEIEENSGTENGTETEGNTEAESDAGEESGSDAENDPAAEETSATESDPVSEDENTEESETIPAKEEQEYVFEFTDDLAAYTTKQYHLGEALFAEETEGADGAGMTVNASILACVELRSVEDGGEIYNLGYDSGTDIVQAIAYSWKRDRKELAQGKSPRESGSYQLVIRLGAKAGEYKAAETTIDFQITKAKVEIDFGVSNVNPGAAVSDVALDYAFAEASDGKSFIFQADAEGTEAKDNEIAFDLTVKEAATNNVLKPGDKLVKNKEYTVSAAPKFVGENAEEYAGNYEFDKIYEQRIAINDLIGTKVRLALNAKYDNAQYRKESALSAKNPEERIEKITVKEYDGSPVAEDEPQYTAEVGVPGADKDGKETFTVIPGAAVKTSWHSAVYEAWTEGETAYCNLTVGGELENAPTDAGVYVYKVAYEGDEEQYAASSADIVVEIENIELIIQPKFVTASESFYAGQTAGDVLARVSYELPYAEKEGIFTIPADQSASFWGTSYAGNALTQAYEPVFEVVKSVAVTENGTKTNRTVTLEKEEQITADPSGTTTYEVRFTGYKAVYLDNGAETGRKMINDSADSTTTNYFVKADPETLEKYTAKIEVKDVNAEIDADAVIAGFTADPDFHDAAGKIYDGERLFANRSDYKKAQLRFRDTKAAVPGISGTDLTYKWYSSSYRTVMDAKVKNGEGVFEETRNFESSFRIRNDLISPVDAGIYKLVISYQDKAGRYFAEPVEVYFVIEQQKLRVRLSDKVYTEFSGITAGQFLSDAVIEYSIEPELAKPAAGEKWHLEDINDPQYPYAYAVAWQVEEKQRDADGNAVKDADGNDVYSPLQSYESFVYDEKNAADSYRLSVESFTCSNLNYTVFETTIEETGTTQYKVNRNLSVDDKNTAGITVEEMGSIELRMEGMIEKERNYNGESIYDVLQDDLSKIKAVRDNEDGTVTEVSGVSLKWRVSDLESGQFREYEAEGLSEDIFNLWAAEDGQFIDGGDYEISAWFRGDAAYASMEEQVIARVTVNAIPLTITPPVLEDAFTAGTRAYEVTDRAENGFSSDFRPAIVEGYLERDRAYFSLSELYHTWDGDQYYYGTGYPAWYYDNDEEFADYNPPSFGVEDSDEQKVLVFQERLKGEGGDRYRLFLESAGTLAGSCGRNYYPVSGKATPISVVRGNASVFAAGYENILDVDIAESVSGMTHRVKVLDGIRHTSFQGQEGNFVALEIAAPVEYAEDSDIWNRAVYEVSVEAAGGNIVEGSHWSADNYSESPAITVVFDAGKGYAEFGIRWEEDYVETFKLDFKEENCLGNLRDAVSPKSIAFNAPNKTMAVGAVQNLDVKITKEQKDDVICLGYEVTKGQEYLCVNEYGKVTALKAGGSGTVTVYPMHLVDGVKVPIDDPKAKKASVTIAVKDVATPKISKVISLDYQVTVQYPYVANVDDNYGYRREIYVLEGKNLKEQAFTEKISAMSNEQWEGIFAAAPVFLNNSAEYSSRVYDAKKKSYINTVQYSIQGLKPNTDYTVYVRNVSAVRTLSDGCQVTESAAGSVKGFATTKAQVKILESTLKDRTETDKTGNVGDGSLTWIEYEDVRLSEGSVQLQTKGFFEAWATDPAAEPIGSSAFHMDDSQPLPLPLSGDYKKYYAEPKISYYFLNWADTEGCYDAYDGKEAAPGSYYLSTTSTMASIDKKGKLTLKQPGWIEVVAVDTVTGIRSNRILIRIVAAADSIRGKTTTVQVGQSPALSTLVVYCEGKKALDYWGDAEINGSELKEQIEEGGYFSLSDNGLYITALKGNGTIKLTLTDSRLKKSAQVTVKSVDLAPVKNLKAVDVIDNRFTAQFERNPFAQAYRIELRNARGALMRSVYAENYYVDGYYYGEYDENGNYVLKCRDEATDWDDDYKQGNWRCFCDKKTGKTYGEYTFRGLTQQSKYTVSVQALYGEAVSKAVSKAVTTTKLPASERDLAKDEKGGIKVYVWNYSGYTIDRHPFVSGNDYTLVAVPDNLGAKYAATDALIWSSSDTKTATVKANAGSYSATLKPVKNGSTTIEVKSRITKKVVGRYVITVRNVGDAYASNVYYGDNEDLRGDGAENMPPFTELTLGNPGAVDLSAGQTKWFSFTAPENGSYSFYRMLNGSRNTSGIAVYNDIQNGSSLGYSNVGMTEGQTVYVKATATGSYTVHAEKRRGVGVSDRTPLTIGSVTMQVTYGQYFVFTAEKEGLYSFSGLNFRVEDTEGNRKTQGNPAQCWLDDKETVYLCAQGSGQCTIMVEKIPVQTLTADGEALRVSADANGWAWFSFKAPKAAEYEFMLSGNSWNYKELWLYHRSDITNPIEGDSEYNNPDITFSHMLGSGTTILIKVQPSGSMLSVKTKAAIEEVKAEEDMSVTLPSDGANYFVFHAPADGFYRFTSTGAAGAEAELYRDLTGTPVDSSYGNDFSVSCYIKGGSQGYLKVWSGNGTQQADVVIRVESFIPDGLGEEEISREIANDSDMWFGFTAQETEKYTFTFTSDVYCRASLYTLSALETENPAPVKELSGSGKKHFDYEMTAGQTVYWKVRNDNYRSANVTAKAEKYTIPALQEGSDNFDIEANTVQIVTFTAPEAGKYIFRFKSNSSAYAQAYLYKDSGLLDIEDSVSFNYSEKTKEYNAAAGETLYWKLENNGYVDIVATVGVERFVIQALNDGNNSAVINSGSSKYFSFTAPEDGTYIFAFMGNGASGSVYKHSDMYFNDQAWWCSVPSGYYKAETCTLAEQETMYWEIKNNSGAVMNAAIMVKKDVPQEITAAGASAEVTYGLEQWFSFTADADEDARYWFTFTGDSGSYCNAYFYRDRNGSYEGSSVALNTSAPKTDERYIEAGQTIYWKAQISSSGYPPFHVTVKAEKILMTAVTEETEVSKVIPSGGEAKWFAIDLPEDAGEYIITAISAAMTCNAYLYADLSADSALKSGSVSGGSSVNWTVPGSTGSRVYLKVTNSNSSNDARFTVSVRKRTEEPITENSNAVIIALGAEQWFSYTSDTDTNYDFTLISQNERCDWYWYAGDDLSNWKGGGTNVTEYTASDIYIPQGSTVCFKVKNRSVENTTNVTVSVKKYTVDSVRAEEAYSFDTRNQWLKFTAEREGLYSFSMQGVSNSYRYFLLQKELSGMQVGSAVSNEGSIVYFMGAGESVYLDIYSNGSNNVTGTLTVSPITVADLSANGETTMELVDKNGAAEFVAAEAGIYTFEAAGTDTSVRGYLYLYSDLNDDREIQNRYYSGTASAGLVYPMMAGDKIYVKVKATNTNASELTVRVTKKQDMEVIAVDQENALSLTANEEKWLCFRTDGNHDYYYANALWDSGEEITIQFSYASWSSYYSPYNSNSWENSMSKSQKMEAFENHSLSTYYKENVFCIRIVPDQDIDITFSVATAQN